METCFGRIIYWSNIKIPKELRKEIKKEDDIKISGRVPSVEEIKKLLK